MLSDAFEVVIDRQAAVAVSARHCPWVRIEEEDSVDAIAEKIITGCCGERGANNKKAWDVCSKAYETEKGYITQDKADLDNRDFFISMDSIKNTGLSRPNTWFGPTIAESSQLGEGGLAGAGRHGGR